MKKLTKTICLVFFCAVAVSIYACGVDNSAKRSSKKQKNAAPTPSSHVSIPKESEQNTILKPKSYKFKDDCCSIDVLYPEFEETKFVATNREIDSTIQVLVSEARSKKLCTEIKAANPNTTIELMSEYKIIREDKQFISFYLQTYFYTGGAHGTPARLIFTLDTKSGKKLKLNELFAPEYHFQKHIASYIRTEIAKRPNDYFKNPRIKINDNTPFLIDNENLIIVYPPYEIAPYSSGFPTFEIPLEKFGDKFKYATFDPRK